MVSWPYHYLIPAHSSIIPHSEFCFQFRNELLSLLSNSEALKALLSSPHGQWKTIWSLQVWHWQAMALWLVMDRVRFDPGVKMTMYLPCLSTFLVTLIYWQPLSLESKFRKSLTAHDISPPYPSQHKEYQKRAQLLNSRSTGMRSL